MSAPELSGGLPHRGGRRDPQTGHGPYVAHSFATHILESGPDIPRHPGFCWHVRCDDHGAVAQVAHQPDRQHVEPFDRSRWW